MEDTLKKSFRGAGDNFNDIFDNLFGGQGGRGGGGSDLFLKIYLVEEADSVVHVEISLHECYTQDVLHGKQSNLIFKNL